MTRLSVPKMVGLIMGAWFLASGFGNFAAAQIAKLTTADGGGADQVILVYSSVGKLAVGVGISDIFDILSNFNFILNNIIVNNLF